MRTRRRDFALLYTLYTQDHPTSCVGKVEQRMQALRIVVLCLGAAITYGIAHDEVTAHLCIEYFTIGHPAIFPTQDPTLLALGWGVVATWWMGLLLGVPLSVVARAGGWPKLDARWFVRPALTLMGICAVVAVVAGLTGYIAAMHGSIALHGGLARSVAPSRQALFLADLWAHTASYAAAALGGGGVWIWTWRARAAMRIVRRGCRRSASWSRLGT